VLTRCAGQLRIIAGSVLGLDLTAALGLGDALGHDRRALAELLPAGEAGLLAALNQQTATSDPS
jgi:hypothetical protein